MFEKYSLGSLTLDNRVALAPLTRARAGLERMPNDLMAKYYCQRASAGLMISEATVVSKQGIGWQQSPGIYNTEQAQAWKSLVEKVHSAGGTLFLQLWHCGRASHSDFHEGALPVAPSAIRLESEDGIHTPQGKKQHEVPRALETDEIPAVVDDYRQAAVRAKEAGFDGLEVHAANGYLLNQFLESKTNRRSDQYGGSLENRFRLLGEVVSAVSEVFPAERIGVRLSPNGVFNDMGSEDYRETTLYAAERLNALGVQYLHVLDGLAFGFHELGEPVTLAEIRKVFDRTLIGNCGYDKDTAEEQIAAGNADLIAFGRPYISNPDLAERFRNDWPLAEPAPMEHWYSHEPRGYADYPAYDEA